MQNIAVNKVQLMVVINANFNTSMRTIAIIILLMLSVCACRSSHPTKSGYSIDAAKSQ